MAKSDLRVWAVKGAEQRLVEIAEEAKAIFASFPELRAQGRGFTSGGTAESSTGRRQPTQRKPARRKKRTMSAEARKRIGDAQRKRWAKQKAANGTADQPGVPSHPKRANGGSRRKKR